MIAVAVPTTLIGKAEDCIDEIARARRTKARFRLMPRAVESMPRAIELRALFHALPPHRVLAACSSEGGAAKGWGTLEACEALINESSCALVAIEGSALSSQETVELALTRWEPSYELETQD